MKKTSSPSYAGRISFVPLPTLPHPAYRDSVTLKKVIGEPDLEIGLIIRVPDRSDPERPRLNKWIFVPNLSGDIQTENSCSIYALQNELQKRYCYCKPLRAAISADDDEFESKVLRWSGHAKEWDESELGMDYSLVRDVLRICPSAEVVSQIWDGDFPGRSGVRYKLYSSNQSKLKREIGCCIKLLAKKKISQPSQQEPSPSKKAS